jgi:hypothetical protein
MVPVKYGFAFYLLYPAFSLNVVSFTTWPLLSLSLSLPPIKVSLEPDYCDFFS